MADHDALLKVFLSGAKRELFHSVAHRSQIWREDPFDVESVHTNARAQFQKLLTQATTPPGLEAGRILLLLGESGSGKTHLMRAFRNQVHSNGDGFVAYMQMSTAISSYARYLVSNLVDSLDQPYYESKGTDSGLLRLSTAIASRCGDPTVITTLREKAGLSTEQIADLVEQAADRIISHPRYADLDLDLVRAMLYLQRRDPALKQRVVKFLRCEALSDRDRHFLGGIAPKAGEEDAQRMVEHIGAMIAAFDHQSLILCVDQLEDTWHSGEGEEAELRFRRVMSSLCAVADQVPSCLIVIACLQNYYDKLRTRLTRSTLDRLENDPVPVKLLAERSIEEVEKLIAKRLDYLYETAGVKPAEGAVHPLHPFPREFAARYDRMRTRDVLDACQTFRDACIDAGAIVGLSVVPDNGNVTSKPGVLIDDKTAVEKLEQHWNDYLVQYKDDLPDAEPDIAKLFAWAVALASEGMQQGYRFEAEAKGETINIRVLVPHGKDAYREAEEIFLSICNRAAQGNGLSRQLETARKQAKQRVVAILRTAEYPRFKKGTTWKILDDILQKGGRMALLEPSDLRKIAAFKKFRAEQAQHPHVAPWLREGKHLAKLLPIIHVLDLEQLERLEKPAAARPTQSTSPSHRS